MNKKSSRGSLRRLLTNVPLQLYRKTPLWEMVILRFKTSIKTLCNWKATWDRSVFLRKEKTYTIFTTNSVDLTLIFNWLGVYANDGGNVVRQQHQTLKAMTDCKLLTLNILGQHLSLLKTINFHRKQTNQAFDVSLGTNVK